MVKVHQYGIMSAPTTAQDAALAAVVEGEADVERMLAEYDRRRRLLVDGLNALGPRHVRAARRVLRLPADHARPGSTDETFTERLLTEERVAVVPGERVRAVGRRPRAHVLRDVLRAARGGARRIGRFVERVRPRLTV